MCNKRLSASTRVGHPRRQQRQRAVGLPDDEVSGAGVALYANDGNDFAAAWMKRIEDPNLYRRKPGSMTLLRPASAKAGWPVRSATRPCMGLPMSRCSCGPPDTILWTEGSLPLGAITRAATLYSVGPVRGPDHEAVIRFEGEAPSWWAHSADGVIARPCAGFTATSDQCRQPVASARLDVEG